MQSKMVVDVVNDGRERESAVKRSSVRYKAGFPWLINTVVPSLVATTMSSWQVDDRHRIGNGS